MDNIIKKLVNSTNEIETMALLKQYKDAVLESAKDSIKNQLMVFASNGSVSNGTYKDIKVAYDNCLDLIDEVKKGESL